MEEDEIFVLREIKREPNIGTHGWVEHAGVKLIHRRGTMEDCFGFQCFASDCVYGEVWISEDELLKLEEWITQWKQKKVR